MCTWNWTDRFVYLFWNSLAVRWIFVLMFDDTAVRIGFVASRFLFAEHSFAGGLRAQAEFEHWKHSWFAFDGDLSERRFHQSLAIAKNRFLPIHCGHHVLVLESCAPTSTFTRSHRIHAAVFGRRIDILKSYVVLPTTSRFKLISVHCSIRSQFHLNTSRSSLICHSCRCWLIFVKAFFMRNFCPFGWYLPVNTCSSKMAHQHWKHTGSTWVPLLSGAFPYLRSMCANVVHSFATRSTRCGWLRLALTLQ